MKRIIIDGTTISSSMDGLSQYILNITEQFARNFASRAHFVLLLRPDQCPDYYLEIYRQSGMELEFIDITPIGPKRDRQFRKYLKGKKFDVFYEPSNQYPSSLKGGVYTVHDLIYELYPSQLGRLARLKRFFLHRNVAIGLAKSSKVVAISEYTKSEILRLHKVDPAKITVVYEGYEHLKKNGVQPKADGECYFFYVGSSRGHKNLGRLLEAYAIAQTPYKLVVAGNMSRLDEKERELIDRINQNGERVFCTGWISDAELAHYFSNASAFVFPSLSEGFGIPILEAFYYKVPLLCSNNTVFPEIAGDAAIYFDPTSVEDMAHKLSKVEELSQGLVVKGEQQLKKYSWEKTAQQVFDLLNDE